MRADLVLLVAIAIPLIETSEKLVGHDLKWANNIVAKRHLFLERSSSLTKATKKFNEKKDKSTVLALMVINNFLNVPLTHGFVHNYKENGEIPGTCPAPTRIGPGERSGFVTIQKGNTRGTSGAAVWKLSLDNDDDDGKVKWLSVMWTVPYSFQFYYPYVAIGLDNQVRNAQETFEVLYKSDSQKV